MTCGGHLPSAFRALMSASSAAPTIGVIGLRSSWAAMAMKSSRARTDRRRVSTSWRKSANSDTSSSGACSCVVPDGLDLTDIYRAVSGSVSNRILGTMVSRVRRQVGEAVRSYPRAGRREIRMSGCVSSQARGEIVEYPDSGKVGAGVADPTSPVGFRRLGMFRAGSGTLDYWDGEHEAG